MLQVDAELAKLKLWDVLDGAEGVPDRFTDDRDGSLLRTGYSRRELKVVRSTNVKLARMLSRSRRDFRIFFLPSVNPDSGLVQRKEGGPVPYGAIERELHWEGIDAPNDDASSINVILLGMGEHFAREGNLPPTPWIVIHWIAHGVMKTEMGYLAKTYMRLLRAFIDSIDAMYGIPDDDQSSDVIRDFMRGVFQFRSARKGSLRSPAEGLHEAMVEHIIRGDVRLGDPPKRLGGRPAVDISDWDSFRDGIKDALEERFDDLLDQAKGRWFIV